MANRLKAGLKTLDRAWGFIILSALLSILVGSSLIQATPEGDALHIIKEMLHAEVNWTGNDPCQAWEGVSCSLNHVIELNLSMKRLKGTLPAEIGQLFSLESLDLSFNSIEGNIPIEIANLTNLHILILRHNLFSGGFPLVILKLKKIVSLRLDSNHQFTGPLPSGIGQLSTLESLFLGNCSFTGRIPVDFGNLTNLINLSIWGNVLNSTIPVELSKLTNLEYLNVHDAEMHGALPPEFGSLHKMKNLTLQSNFLSGTIPESWSSMVNIQHLSVFNNRLSGPFPTWMSRFSTKVNVGCNYFVGPKPTSFPESYVQGNCFDSDLDKRSCLGTVGCVSFYSQPENAQYRYLLQHSKKNNIWVIVGASLSVVFMVVIILVGLYALKIRKKHRENLEVLPGDTQTNTDTLARNTTEPWDVPNGIRRFDLEEILRATEDFGKTHELGFGGFGRVYKGYLGNGCVVAAKRASPSSIQGQKQFQNEIVILSRLHHRCLVKLEGFCEEAGEQILVYEFMKKGNLDDLIWDEQKRWSLDWYKRIEIAISIAQGLDYLHSFADPPIIHRDVKPSNILLDEHMNAKLSDFGISRSTTEMIDTHISTGPAGTLGFVDPHYFLRKHLTRSSDVYSYGVVLLMLITAQKAIDRDRVEEVNLVEWVKLKYQADDLDSIIDSQLLVRETFPQSVRTVTELALKCAAFDRSERPLMSEAVQILETLLKNEVTCERRRTDPCFDEAAASSSTTYRSFTDLDTSITGR